MDIDEFLEFAAETLSEGTQRTFIQDGATFIVAYGDGELSCSYIAYGLRATVTSKGAPTLERIRKLVAVAIQQLIAVMDGRINHAA